MAGRGALLTALALALLIGLGLSGCGGSDGDDNATTTADRAEPTPSGPPLRIGSKDFTEATILGELYGQALEAKGFAVVLKPNIGSSELIHRALRRGALDMYPEYIGVLLSEVAHMRERPRSATAAYKAAQAFERKSGYSLLAQTPFADTNALAVMPQFAARHGVRTIGDLRKVKGTLKVGAQGEFATRFEGLVGLRAVYGLDHLRAVTAEGKRRYTALETGEVDVTSVYSTEGQLAGDTYAVLADPKGLFASGHVAPILSDALLEDRVPALRTTLDAVSRVLTTPDMRKMNAAVDLGNRRPADVAAQFLRAKGLG